MSNIIKFAALQKSPVIISCNPPKIEPEVPAAKDLEAAKHLDAAKLAAQRISDEILSQARKEAASIIDNSKTVAAQNLAEAEQQAEQLKKQAYDEGHQSGYQDGLSQGNQSALTEMRQAIDKSAEKAEHMLALAQQEAQEMILAAERKIIDISLAVARKVLAREMEENPVIILPIVKAALEKVRNQEEVTLRVNPEDFEIVLHAKRDLQILLGGDRSLTINADHSICSGGCMIDTAYGTVDARLDIQFESLKKALQDVLP